MSNPCHHSSPSSVSSSISTLNSPIRSFPFTRSNMPKLRLPKLVNDHSQTPDSSSSKPRTRLSKSTVILKPKPKPKPVPQLQLERLIGSSLESDLHNLPILSPDFFLIDALELAPLLLGKFLRRDDVVLQITEVEAYRTNDSACHGRFGITPRTAPMFGPGGHAYVYLCYGLHVMLNVVADIEGAGAAVLIRSAAPVAGLKTIQQRRGQISEKPILLTGPGKVGQALGLTTEWSNHPMFEPGGLELLDGPKPENILVGPRVGIEYALPEHASAPWRFAMAGTPWISAPKNTLSPP